VREHKLRNRIAAGAAGVGLFFAGGVTGYLVNDRLGNALDGLLPDQQGVPDSSQISADRIHLAPKELDCHSASVYDISGSTIRTAYKLGRFNVGGYGARITEGKVAKLTCVEGSGVQITDGERDGKKVKVVNIEIDKVRSTTDISDGDTVIQRVNPPTTKVAGAVIDVASVYVETACRGVAFIAGADREQCAKLGLASTWNERNQAELESGFRARTEQFVQEECGRAGWATEQHAFIDGYKQQAVEQLAGNDPVKAAQAAELVDVRFTNFGQPTTDEPDFKKSVWDEEYANGVLNQRLPGTPELEFVGGKCTQTQTYQPKF
jgi:hypothetical protein